MGRHTTWALTRHPRTPDQRHLLTTLAEWADAGKPTGSANDWWVRDGAYPTAKQTLTALETLTRDNHTIKHWNPDKYVWRYQIATPQ